MIGSIGCASAGNPCLTRMVGRLGTDASGAVSKDEFVAGRPKSASQDVASRTFATLDTAGDGALTADDLASAFQQMSNQMRSTMLQTQEAAGADAGAGSGGPGGPGGAGGVAESEDGSEQETSLFPAPDTNGDGIVSQAEFLAGKPDDVSEARARSLSTQVSGGTAAGVSLDQFVDGMRAARPAPPDAQAEEAEASRIEDEQLRQLLTVIDTYRNATRATAERKIDTTTSFSA